MARMRKLDEVKARQASRMESDFIAQETEDIDYLLGELTRLTDLLSNAHTYIQKIDDGTEEGWS